MRRRDADAPSSSSSRADGNRRDPGCEHRLGPAAGNFVVFADCSVRQPSARSIHCESVSQAIGTALRSPREYRATVIGSLARMLMSTPMIDRPVPDRWATVRPEEVAPFFLAASVPWWIAGGWALDLFLGVARPASTGASRLASCDRTALGCSPLCVAGRFSKPATGCSPGCLQF